MRKCPSFFRLGDAGENQRAVGVFPLSQTALRLLSCSHGRGKHVRWLVEKCSGDSRANSSIRHGLLDFRQQSMGRAPGGCECVARRSVFKLRRITYAHLICPLHYKTITFIKTSSRHLDLYFFIQYSVVSVGGQPKPGDVSLSQMILAS